MSSEASDAGIGADDQNAQAANAADAKPSFTTGWLAHGKLRLAGSKTPPWMTVGGSSDEHTPSEEGLLETGWM